MASVIYASGGAMQCTLCALSWLTQSRWRYVLDVLCCWKELQHTEASFVRCFAREGYRD
jgi:hypothetical protein